MQRTVMVNAAGVVHDTLDGEVLAIRNDTGAYYSMVGSAADVWACVLAGVPVAAIGEVLASRYEVDEAVAAVAVEGFVQQLLDQHLVVEGATAASGSVVPGGLETRGSWEPPVLDVFTDMQDLLLFDPIHEVRPEGWPHVSGPGA